MKQIKDLDPKATISKEKALLYTFETHQKNYANGGAVWPLAKWAHEGFDAKKIEQHTTPDNIQEQPIL